MIRTKREFKRNPDLWTKDPKINQVKAKTQPSQHLTNLFTTEYLNNIKNVCFRLNINGTIL